MTKQKSRVPREEGKFNLWYQNVNNNLPSVAAKIGVVAAELARVTNDSAAWNHLMLRNAAVRSYKNEESEVKKAAFGGDSKGGALTLPAFNLPEKPDGVTFNSGVWDWANKLIQRIVKHDGCTTEIEALLDIELKDDDDISPEEMKGVIKQTTALNGGAVKLKCPMQGLKSYRVFSQRGASGAFEHIGDSTEQEFTDERPNAVAGQPETRQYKTICLEGNKPVGDYSAIETVITKP